MRPTSPGQGAFQEVRAACGGLPSPHSDDAAVRTHRAATPGLMRGKLSAHDVGALAPAQRPLHDPPAAPGSLTLYFPVDSLWV